VRACRRPATTPRTASTTPAPPTGRASSSSARAATAPRSTASRWPAARPASACGTGTPATPRATPTPSASRSWPRPAPIRRTSRAPSFGPTQAELETNARFAQFAFDLEYRLPKPPPSPRLHLRPAENRVTLLWDDSPERTVDETSPQPGGLDFEGYRVYLGSDRNDLRRVAQFDLPDSAGFNTGLAAVRLAQPEIVDGDTVRYSYTVEGLRDGFSYFAAVTSYDIGDRQVPSLESGISQNKKQLVSAVAPGAQPGRGVAVFPNPYKVEATWDQGTLVRDHYLWFANLPQRCRLSVFTLAGDLVFDTEFDGATYHGADARGLYDPRTDLDVDPPDLSGASYAWNLISREGQAVASGIYLFAVRDADTGQVQRGKFLVIKSDREGF
jgi:hypothetical protein